MTFFDVLQRHVSHCSKEWIPRKNSKHKKLKCWVTAGIVVSIRNRDKIKRKLKTQPFNTELSRYVSRYRNILNLMIKKKLRIYFLEIKFMRHKEI